MRRLITPQLRKYLVVAATAFTAGCLTPGNLFSDTKRWISTVPKKPELAPVDVPDWKATHRSSVFSAHGDLPEPVVQVGLPSPEPLKIFPGFLCQYDRRNRIPRWTLELLTGEQLKGDASDVIDRWFYKWFYIKK